MDSAANGVRHPVPARLPQKPRASTHRLCPECRVALWELLQRGATVCLLLVFVLGLAGLGSYDLEASKPRSPNLPVEQVCPQRFQMTKDQIVIEIPICLNA